VARIKEEHARAQLDGSDVIDESLVLASGSKRRCFEQAKVCCPCCVALVVSPNRCFLVVALRGPKGN